MKRVKIKRSDYKNVYFTSDTHYNHNRPWIIDDRGFKNVSDHNEFLDNEFSKLTEDDLLIHLGDWFLTCPQELAKGFIERIPCRTLSVFGNHTSYIKDLYNKSLPEFAKKHNLEVAPVKLEGTNVEMYPEGFHLQIDNDLILCGHYAPLTFDTCHQKHPIKIACGHSHGGLVGANPTDFGIGKILDVGVDNAMKYHGGAMFTYEQFVEIIGSKPVVKNDHH